MILKAPLILASNSPRRQQLLKAIEIPFEICAADIVEEIWPDETPSDAVQRLAAEKASAIADNRPDTIVIAADTLVVVDNDILGKPESAEDAIGMLKRLEGRMHQVLTGVALMHKNSGIRSVFVEKTFVTFDSLSESEIREYVETGSPLDKAGSYGIQDDRGALFVQKIDGDFYNVMGLPLNRLYRVLHEEFGDFIS